MKKNLMKKIGALSLVLVMVLAMSVATLAADPVAENPTLATGTAPLPAAVPETDGNFLGSVAFNVYFNENKGAIAHPAATFTYTIAAGEAVADKGIEAGDIAKVGLGTVGTTTATAAWTMNDTAVSKSVTVAFGTFTKSGIYRYTITQSAITGDMEDIGIESEDSGSTAAYTMILDVYVNNTLKVTGAVLAKNDATLTLNTDAAGDEMAYVVKTDGFRNKLGDNTEPTDPTNPTDPDPDPTDDLLGYKLTITKTTDGAMADATYKFPFEISTSSDKTAVSGLKIKIVPTTNAVADKVTVPALDTDGYNTTIGATLDGTVAIANGGSVTICGLPKTVAFAIAEKVDATEGYTVTITKTDSDFAAAPTVAANTMPNPVDGAKISGVMKDANPTINFKNARNTISPTGVLLRVAPYVAVMGGGFALLLVSKRSKKEEEEA